MRCRCVKRALTRSSRIPTFIDREARFVVTQQIILGLPGPPRSSASSTRPKGMPDIPLHQHTGVSIWKLWRRASPLSPFRARNPVSKSMLNGGVDRWTITASKSDLAHLSPFTREGSQVQSLCRPPFSPNLFKRFRFALSLVPHA